jgi:Ca-activated chloride channel homolog
VVAGLALTVVGLAHPTLTSTTQDPAKTIVLTFDTSGSMAATDVQPSRIAAAQQAAVDFVKHSPADVRIGFVQFASTIEVTQTPSTDHQALTATIQSVRLGGGTAIGDSIVAAIAMIDPSGSAHRGGGAIVVMSDGATNQGVTDAYASQQAVKAGIRVSTIAFGTSSGVVHPDGQTVPVPSSPSTLGLIAHATGGTALVATDAAQLQDIFAHLGTTVAPIHVHHDYGDLLILMGLVVLVTASLLTLLWFSRIN